MFANDHLAKNAILFILLYNAELSILFFLTRLENMLVIIDSTAYGDHYVHNAQWLTVLGTWHGPFYDDGNDMIVQLVLLRFDITDEHHREDSGEFWRDGEADADVVDSVLQQLALYGLDIVVPKLAQICTNCVIVTLCGQKILLMF